MHPDIQLAMIGGQEIIVILLIVLIFFGGKKIPELMRGLGKGVKEYKKAINNFEDQLSDEDTVDQSSQNKEKRSIPEEN